MEDITKGLLPCPICGSEPAHGISANGKHVVYCEDHMQCSSVGDTEQHAVLNFNLRQWDNSVASEEDLIDDEDE